MAPVEYAVAVEEYLGQAVLGAASRRVYRISLTGWAWPLVGKQVPRGAARRGAVPPIVPLALLDDPDTGRRLGSAVTERAAAARLGGGRGAGARARRRALGPAAAPDPGPAG